LEKSAYAGSGGWVGGMGKGTRIVEAEVAGDWVAGWQFVVGSDAGLGSVGVVVGVWGLASSWGDSLVQSI
jgi:hypothetical protein